MDSLPITIISLILIIKIGILLLGLIKYKAFNSTLKVLYYLLVASFITDSISFLVIFNGYENVVFFNIYTIIEGVLFMLYFKHLNEKWSVPFGLLLFLSVAIIEWTVYTQNNGFIDISTVVEACLLIVFALRFFGRMLGELKIGRLTEYPFFWINCAVLIYFAGSVFLFAFSKLIMKQGLMFMWHFHNFIHIIYLLLIGIAFWKVRSTQI